ncbi:MAG: family 20 glycosylhydrolase [Lutibacter sp.]|nr:family 20 glycosylhydrolase [Lutibacter sp.]
MRPILFIWMVLFSGTCIAQEQALHLLPWPQSIRTDNGQCKIGEDFTLTVNNADSRRIAVASTKFIRRLGERTGVFFDHGFAFTTGEIANPTLEINYKRIGELAINEDESYFLQVSDGKIDITAETDIGVIYALETLLQLLTIGPSDYYFPAVQIADKPRFTWRGLMIDVARHFQPIGVLKRNIDAMAAVKMNVLHWHLTDDQGFRIESTTHPALHKLGSDGLYYTQHQIKDLIQYAADRGIRVVPEVDVPGHATAILTAYPEIGSKKGVYTLERYAGIFDPTLDPTNEDTYRILGDLFGEMAQLFPDPYIHIGGDENEGRHWNQNEAIQLFMQEHRLKTNHDLQTYFNIRLEKILKALNKKLMGWEEIMTDDMPKTALIHSWKGVNEGMIGGSSLIKAAKKGYQTILSNGYYIDLMLPVSSHYLVDPIPENTVLTEAERTRILGGEATMWGELVTPLTIDSRIWPRTAAIAERLWSPATIRDLESLYKRLETVSFRLEELGITHLRNKQVILRNMTHNQPTHSLELLSRICEPLKIYTRNKGGTEYKSYAPFTLFADACTADASDQFAFRKATDRFLKEGASDAALELQAFFDQWIAGYEQFNKLRKNPILNNLDPLYARLADISARYRTVLKQGWADKDQMAQIDELLQALAEPVVDVELAVYKDFKRISAWMNSVSSHSLSNKTNRE